MKGGKVSQILLLLPHCEMWTMLVLITFDLSVYESGGVDKNPKQLLSRGWKSRNTEEKTKRKVVNEGEKALIKVLIKWSFLPSGFPICLCRHTHTHTHRRKRRKLPLLVMKVLLVLTSFMKFLTAVKRYKAITWTAEVEQVGLYFQSALI